MGRERDKLYGALERISDKWVSRGWSWDRRFECAASTFDTSLRDEAARLVYAELPHQWTSRNLQQASDLVALLADTTGGVRSDQLIYTSDEIDGAVAFGLWWPWGSEGTNISLRVGITGRTSYDDQLVLRKTFKITDD